MKTSTASPVTLTIDEEMPQPTTSIALFLKKNSELTTMKKQRDGKGGIFKWIGVALFAWLLFSPALVLIPELDSPWIVAVLWLIIGLILVLKVDYCHIAEAWFICMCRGIIIDMPKTDAPLKWMCSGVVKLSLIFIFVFFLIEYLARDPNLKFEQVHIDLPTAVLGILGLTFVLLLSKGVVDVEGATGTLSLNMVIHYFNDRALLSDHGFHVVHLSQLLAFVKQRGDKTGRADGTFSWDELHKLSAEPLPKPSVCSLDNLTCGTRLVRFLKPHKDLDK